MNMVFPIAIYGSESWTINVAFRKKKNRNFEIISYRKRFRILWTAHRIHLSILEELDIQKDHQFSVKYENLSIIL